MSKVKVRWARNVDGWHRGDEVTVMRDAYVNKLIDRGMVTVVEDYEPVEPGRNASRALWVSFLEAQGYSVHPQETRRDLIDRWDGVSSRG